MSNGGLIIMKKLSIKQVRHLNSKSRAKFAKNQNSNPEKNYHNQAKQLYCPKILSLSENYHESMCFLDEILNYMHDKSSINIFNFKNVNKIGPCALLLLGLYKIAQSNRNKSNPRVKRKFWNNKIFDELSQADFFNLLGIKAEAIPNPLQKNIKVPKFYLLKGKANEPMQTKQIGDFLRKLNIKDTFSAVSEAIKNVINHAYKNQDGDWWLFGEQRGNMLHLIVADLGMGIPTNYRNKDNSFIETIFNKTKEIFSGYKDSDILKIALEYSKSSTNLRNRGNGLPEILAMVKENCELCIYSNHAKCHLQFGKEIAIIELVKPVNGTIIELNLDLRYENDKTN